MTVEVGNRWRGLVGDPETWTVGLDGKEYIALFADDDRWRVWRCNTRGTTWLSPDDLRNAVEADKEDDQ